MVVVVVDGFYYTIMIYGLIAVFSFAIQLLLCFNAEKIQVKRIPVYVILFFFILAAFFHIGAFGTGFLSAEQIAAFLIAIGAGAALLGNVLAWIVYVIRKRK